MLRIMLGFRFRLLAVSACALLLAGGCQPMAETAALQQAASPGADKADHACSYAYFLWGRHAELLLRFDEALEFYQKALICDDQAEFVSEKVPILLLRLERTDEAAIWLNNYLQTHSDRTGMRMLYAKVLLKQKKNTEAMEQYRLISEQHPDDPTILMLLAEMYMGADQAAKARPLLERVLAQDPASYPGHILMARLCQEQNQIDEAVEHYQKALERNWSSELNLELSELYIKNGRYDEAASLLESVVERDEQNESARVALIHVYLLQQKVAQALTELNQLKTYTEQPQRVDLTIARLYAKQGHYDKAAAILEKILDKENLSEARYFLAVLLAQQQKYGRALKQLRLIDQGASEYPDGLLLQVRILKEQDKVEEARQLLERHLDTGKLRTAEMYVMLSALYQIEGRDDVGKKVLLQGLEIFPNDENLLYEYGLLLEDNGDHNAALAIMQKIISIKPDSAAALNFVGFSWADKKINLDQALEYIQRAIELKPDDGYIRDSLGWVYYRLGKFDQAIKELEAAVQLSPEDAAILEHLGDVYLEKGRVRDALQTYKKAVKFATEDKDKTRIREKIRILDKQGIR
ncbi:MAG: tetratricopeptide repeat protein [Desulfobulbus sp.]|jgi:tetratricopeptide (TPR) repeat protein|uniref:tetratricopeptide repeat protein n=1 Tax=Desulfobulbus sp. TaxID=895 RepID=UPI00283C29E1|nr:tetratricopeptide repeat protein [Desulfobulbus sp.]MDR2550872.1 tetratricopeptide repeat protein [Desulfobulbus sp.]